MHPGMIAHERTGRDHNGPFNAFGQSHLPKLLILCLVVLRPRPPAHLRRGDKVLFDPSAIVMDAGIGHTVAVDEPCSIDTAPESTAQRAGTDQHRPGRRLIVWAERSPFSVEKGFALEVQVKLLGKLHPNVFHYFSQQAVVHIQKKFCMFVKNQMLWKKTGNK